MTANEERIPPHDRDMEMGVLGAAMAHGSAALEVVSHLKREDFYIPSSQHVYDAIAGLVSAGQEVDAMLVKRSATIVDPFFIVECVTAGVVPSRVAAHVEELKKMSNARKVIEHCTMLAARAHYVEDDEDIVATAIDELMELADGGHAKASSMLNLMDERILSAQNPEDFFTVDGFDGLHLFGGDFVVVGGRPGTGKTAYVLQQAMSWAEHSPVMFYSYEMTEHQLADRVISRAAGMPISAIEDGLTPADVDHISDSISEILEPSSNVYVRRAAGMSNSELFADMYRFKARGGKIVVIDYLQLAADKSKMGLVHDTTLFSNKLRRVALDTGLLVVAVAQLSRGSIDRQAIQMPLISDLRESGAIEQDATAICLLMAVPNPKYSSKGEMFITKATTVFMDFKMSDLDAGTDDPSDDKVFVVVDWAKVRQGKARRWPFIFDGSSMKFTPVPRLGGVRMTDYPGRRLFRDD